MSYIADAQYRQKFEKKCVFHDLKPCDQKAMTQIQEIGFVHFYRNVYILYHIIV